MVICEGRNLSFQRENKRLLSNLSFQIHDQTLSLILGSNGSGKTLLLRLMQGLSKPNKGDLVWHGSTALERRSILQSPIFLNRSVAKNMRFVAKTLNLSQATAIEALERVDLQDQANQPANSLSGGEQQRLAFARETLGQPKVLLMDEPTANLDRDATRDIENLMSETIETGAKIVLVSHNREQIARLTARHVSDVLFLHQGRLLFHGTSEDFQKCPDPDVVKYREGTRL